VLCVVFIVAHMAIQKSMWSGGKITRISQKKLADNSKGSYVQ